MNLTRTAAAILEAEGYSILWPEGTSTLFIFEDDTVVGFCKSYESVSNIIDNWEADQDSFIVSHSKLLRTAPQKAWNAYSVFVTEDESTSEHTERIANIEENFRASRKIVKTGIMSKDDLCLGLLSLLPIQNVVSLQTEDLMASARERLDFIDDNVQEALLAVRPEGDEEDDLAAREIVRLLMEE